METTSASAASRSSARAGRQTIVIEQLHDDADPGRAATATADRSASTALQCAERPPEGFRRARAGAVDVRVALQADSRIAERPNAAAAVPAAKHDARRNLGRGNGQLISVQVFGRNNATPRQLDGRLLSDIMAVQRSAFDKCGPRDPSMSDFDSKAALTVIALALLVIAAQPVFGRAGQHSIAAAAQKARAT